MKLAILIIVSLVSTAPSFSHDEGGESGPSIGKGKGVESYDEHEGFTLSQQAINRLNIIYKDISPDKKCDLKNIQIVAALDHKEIFIVRNGKFKSVDAVCSSLKATDKVVVKGAEFLRVIEMDLGSAHEDEHDEHEENKTHEKGKAHHD